MLATFRTHFVYSNTMYSAAQHLVETLTGQSLQTVLKERVFDVLGMHRTFFGIQYLQDRGADVAIDMASGYQWIPDVPSEGADSGKHGKHKEIAQRGFPEQGGAGDVISCVSDYALWMRAVLSRDTRLVKGKGWKQLFRPRTISGNDYTPQEKEVYSTPLYSLGWCRDNYRGTDNLWHTGRDPGVEHVTPSTYTPLLRIAWSFSTLTWLVSVL